MTNEDRQVPPDRDGARENDGSMRLGVDLPAQVGPPDPQLRELIRHLGGQLAFHVAGADGARALAGGLRAQLTDDQPVMADVADLEVPGRDGMIPVRHYRPHDGTPPGVVVYFHGGGWVIGGLDESDDLCRSLATATGCDVISVGYRLAPEHPFPTAVDDAHQATCWVADEALPGIPVVLLGDSAGGNLAAVVARRFRDLARSEIALQVLVYPVTDHRMDYGSYSEHGERLLISGADMRWFWDQYVPDHNDRLSADVSPLLAEDLHGLPPALILVAEYDPLRDEVLAYARRLYEEGVEVTVDRYDTMAHGFFPLVGALDMSRTAVRSVAQTIRRAIARPADLRERPTTFGPANTNSPI